MQPIIADITFVIFFKRGKMRELMGVGIREAQMF